MVMILDEDFEGGADGAAITVGNSDADTIAGTPTFSTAHAVTGTRCMRVNASVLTAYSKEGLSGGSHYNSFYLWCPAIPSTRTNLSFLRDSGTVRGSLALNTDGTLMMRNVSLAAWTSTTTVKVNGFTRIEWDVLPTGQILRIYKDANLHTLTPTETSNLQALTNSSITSINLGSATAVANTDLSFDRWRMSNTESPGPAPGTEPQPVPVHAMLTGSGWVPAVQEFL